jgi:hypothetical protein
MAITQMPVLGERPSALEITATRGDGYDLLDRAANSTPPASSGCAARSSRSSSRAASASWST